MFKILGFKKEKKKKKNPPLQICEFQWKMSICGNWKVLWCFQCISWIGERKKRLKASFWNGWKAPFQHFGRETFLVFILKWLSIYFFHYIMCYKYDTKSSQIEAWHLCLLKVNCFELPERTLRCFFFLLLLFPLQRTLTSPGFALLEHLAPFQHPPGNGTFILLGACEGTKVLQHGPECHIVLPIVRNSFAKEKTSHHRDARAQEEGERHGLKVLGWMCLCPLGNDWCGTADIQAAEQATFRGFKASVLWICKMMWDICRRDTRKAMTLHSVGWGMMNTLGLLQPFRSVLWSVGHGADTRSCPEKAWTMARRKTGKERENWA